VKSLRIRVGSISKFKLPLSDEGSFKVKHKEIPMFARIENIIYTLKPMTQAFLGINKVKGKVSNMWGSIDFEFQIEVFNEPPYFVKQPSDRYIMQDTSVVFSLPAHKDEEGQTVTVNIVEVAKKSMPIFMTF
jgi:hypothetical protein